MTIARTITLLISVALAAVGASQSQAQQPPPQSPNMTFFITSTGPGKGGDLGGLEGADRHCQTLAQGGGRRQQDLARLPEQQCGAPGRRGERP